mgnify:CR=1 FL=1
MPATTAVFEPIGSPPVASFTAVGDFATVPLTVTSDASASTDVDNDIVSYAWDFGDGNQDVGVTVMEIRVAVNMPQSIIVALSLIVFDDSGQAQLQTVGPL